MAHAPDGPNQQIQHRLRVTIALTAVGGGAVAFSFGFLIGWLADPVPGMLGGVPARSWIGLVLMVAAVCVTLLTVLRTGLSSSRSEGRSEEFALLLRPRISQWTRQVVATEKERKTPSAPQAAGTVATPAAVGDNVGSALERFPSETSMPSSFSEESVRSA